MAKTQSCSFHLEVDPLLNPLVEKTWSQAERLLKVLDELWTLILEFQFILISGLVSFETLSGLRKLIKIWSCYSSTEPYKFRGLKKYEEVQMPCKSILEHGYRTQTSRFVLLSKFQSSNGKVSGERLLQVFG
jgi:hypothetical protein